MQRTETWVAYAERPNGDVVIIDVCDDWEFEKTTPVGAKEFRVDERTLANVLKSALERVARSDGLRNAPKGGGRALDQLLTVDALAIKLHVSSKTVRSWMYLRKIPFTKIGRRVYFSSDVIDQLLARNVVATVRSSSSPGSRPTGQGGA